MSTRIHIVVDEAEKERFRREAAREGLSLSEWIREAARDRMARTSQERLDSLEALGAFFDACDDRESGVEPEWDHHERRIAGPGRPGDGDAAGTGGRTGTS